MLEDLYFSERGSVCEWIEGNLVFPRETSPNSPGPVSLSRHPYLKEPLESLRDSRISHLYMVFAAQSGKTTAALLALAWLITHDPMPLLWALPSDTLAKPFSKNRLQPFLKANPCLSKHIRRDTSLFTPLEMSLDNMPIYVTGVTSPGRLSSRPVAYVIQDEEAKFEHVNKKESHAAALIEERTKSFPRRLIIHCSTPNVEDEPYWQGYLGTDMRVYFMPCPHCSQMFIFEFSRENLVWEGESLEEIEETAHYVCPHCRRAIYDSDKFLMMQEGEWRSTNPSAPPSMRGYHLNSLYSPYVTFGQFAKKFVNCTRQLLSQLELQNFRNSWEALPFIKYSIKVKEKSVENLRDPAYRKKQIPAAPLYLVASYDPGETNTHWTVYSLEQDGAMSAIDWGTIIGIRTTPEREGISAHFKSLEYEFNGEILAPVLGCIDSGWNTEKVYEECRELPGQLFPMKGTNSGFGTWNSTTLYTQGNLELYTYNDRAAKIELYAERIAHARKPGIRIPIDSDNEFIRGLSGQTLEERGVGNSQWKRIPWDHFGDCTKLAMVSWWVLKNNFSHPEASSETEDS